MNRNTEIAAANDYLNACVVRNSALALDNIEGDIVVCTMWQNGFTHEIIGEVVRSYRSGGDVAPGVATSRISAVSGQLIVYAADHGRHMRSVRRATPDEAAAYAIERAANFAVAYSGPVAQMLVRGHQMAQTLARGNHDADTDF